MAATTHKSALDRFVPQTRYVAWLGPPTLDIRLWCEVWVCGLDNMHPFIKLIGVVMDISEMVDSDLLMYFFVLIKWVHASQCRGRASSSFSKKSVRNV